MYNKQQVKKEPDSIKTIDSCEKLNSFDKIIKLVMGKERESTKYRVQLVKYDNQES